MRPKVQGEMLMRVLLSGLLLLLCLAAGPAPAQDKYPSKPITILMGYPPGGSTDTTARAIAPVLERILGQPIVIQNRPGAAALIGTQAVANAAPDGYTITVATTQLRSCPRSTRCSAGRRASRAISLHRLRWSRLIPPC